MSETTSEIVRLRAVLAAAEARAEAESVRAATAEAELAEARAVVSCSEAILNHYRLTPAGLSACCSIY